MTYNVSSGVLSLYTTTISVYACFLVSVFMLKVGCCLIWFKPHLCTSQVTNWQDRPHNNQKYVECDVKPYRTVCSTLYS